MALVVQSQPGSVIARCILRDEDFPDSNKYAEPAGADGADERLEGCGQHVSVYLQGLSFPPWWAEQGVLRTFWVSRGYINRMQAALSAGKEPGMDLGAKCHSFPRLKLNEKVSLEKIKFHCMDHDGGSVFVSPVDKEILQAQKKVGRNGGLLSLG